MKAIMESLKKINADTAVLGTRLSAFGEDDTATALRLFIEHCRLATNQNIRKKSEGWYMSDFRA